MSLVSIPDSLIVLVGLDSVKGVVNSEFSSIYARDKNQELWSSFNNIFNIIIWVSFLLVSIIIIMRVNIIEILLPGFNSEKSNLAVSISLIIFPIFFFKALIGTLQSFFNALKRFYFPVAVNIIPSLFMIISIYLPYYRNELIYNLSFSSLLSNVIILVLTLILTYRIGGKIYFKKIQFDDKTKRILKGCFSIFMLLIAEQLFNLSKNFFASYFGDGAISSLNYARTIPNVLMGFIFATIFSVLLSNLSSKLEVEKKINSKKIFVNTILGLIFIITPLIVILILNDKEVLTLIYKRGNFGLDAINLTLKPFKWEVLSLISFVLYIIPTALYLAKKKYSMINRIGSSVYVLGIFINFILSRFYGYYGISIATFITTFIYAFFLIFYSQKFLGSYKHEIIIFTKIILSGFITTIILFVFKKLFIVDVDYTLINTILYLIISSAIITIIYLILTYILKVSYLSSIKLLFAGK
jgi:putative peptidoglycan lipid II flippase